MDEVKSMVISSRMHNEPEFLEKCILKIYERQESDEQDVQVALYKNGQGFTKPDAPFFSGMAEGLKAGGTLKGKDTREICNRLTKYSKQLAALLTDEEAGV